MRASSAKVNSLSWICRRIPEALNPFGYFPEGPHDFGYPLLVKAYPKGNVACRLLDQTVVAGTTDVRLLHNLIHWNTSGLER
jgi:hypothetical protein